MKEEKSPPTETTSVPDTGDQTTKPTEPSHSVSTSYVPEPPSTPPTLPNKQKGATSSSSVSSFSLASITRKKQWEQQQQKETVEEDLPEQPFDQNTLNQYWQAYHQQKVDANEKNIASLFQLDTPQLTNKNTVLYQVPSSLNKVEIEREFVYFLPYLRKALQNFAVVIHVEVVESEQKNFVYTPEEKYNRLREINPEIDHLKKTLDLDL